MREIPLTRGYVALVDDADYKRVIAAGPWCVCPGGFTMYAQRSVRSKLGRWIKRTRTYSRLGKLTTQTYSVREPARWITQSMHRFILRLRDPKMAADHRDRNGLHNWRSNLRIATKSQNRANSRKPRHGVTSRFRGVHWAKSMKKYCAKIRFHGLQTNLGYFTDEVKAALRYDMAARELFGEFASCNFSLPESGSLPVAT